MARPLLSDVGLATWQAAAGLQAAWGGSNPSFATAPAAGVAGGASGTDLPQGQVLSGTVKAWIIDKGFGFVTPNAGGPDVFVHRNQLTDGQSLVQGALVTFECRFNPARAKYEATSCSGACASEGPTKGYEAPVSSYGGKGSGSQDNLFVAGLPLDMTEESVRDLFGQYGSVAQCKVLPDQPGRTDRAALVRFSDEGQAQWMVENMNGNIPVGMSSPLTVRFAGDRTGGTVGFGKAVLPPSDNRFAPYALSGLGAAAPATVPPVLSGTNLSEASLAAALQQFQAAALAQTARAAVETSGTTASGVSVASASTQLALAGVSSAGLVTSSEVGSSSQGIAAAGDFGSTTSAAQPTVVWLEATDPASGRAYYYHSITRETRWDKPAEMG